MAQMLYGRHSTKKHINTAARYMHLCRQVKGGEDYVTAMMILFNILVEKHQAVEDAVMAKETANDDVILHDSYLDDAIRSCAESCKQYDRDNNGRPVLLEIFPDGKFSPIVKAPNQDEPDLADKIVKRIETLDAEHPVYEYAEKLKVLISNCRNALAIYDDAKKKLKEVKTDEEIACSNVRKQYEFSYHDMIIKFGKSKANKFFPIINPPSKKSSEE